MLPVLVQQTKHEDDRRKLPDGTMWICCTRCGGHPIDCLHRLGSARLWRLLELSTVSDLDTHPPHYSRLSFLCRSDSLRYNECIHRG